MNTKMLGIVTVSALLGTVLSTANFAQDTTGGTEGPRHQMRGNGAGPMRGPMQAPMAGRRALAPAAQPERFIERHDTDGDGQVSESEFTDEHLQGIDEHFERRDTDGDGLISLAEHATPPPRRGPRGPGRPDRPERPERPEIDREAVIACVRETIADFEPQLEGPVDEIFENVDTNGDGMLSLAEVSAALEDRAHTLFSRIDSDGNGYITESEVAAHVDAQLNQRRVMQACVKEVAEAAAN